MRALLRVIQLSKQNLVPFAFVLGQFLAYFIHQVAKNEATVPPNCTCILFEAAALTLTFVKDFHDAFQAVEDQLTPALDFIIKQKLAGLSGYAFQLYATFVANSTELKPNYQMLAQSITENLANWSKEMKYLVPALAIFLSTVIAKHPQYAITQISFI